MKASINLFGMMAVYEWSCGVLRLGILDWIKEWKSSAAEPSGVLSMNYDGAIIRYTEETKRRGNGSSGGKTENAWYCADGQLEH